MGVEWAVQSDDVRFDHQHPSTFGVSLGGQHANMLSTFGPDLLNTQHLHLGASVSIFGETLIICLFSAVIGTSFEVSGVSDGFGHVGANE